MPPPEGPQRLPLCVRVGGDIIVRKALSFTVQMAAVYEAELLSSGAYHVIISNFILH